jgi:hypothetical protein
LSKQDSPIKAKTGQTMKINSKKELNFEGYNRKKIEFFFLNDPIKRIEPTHVNSPNS